MAVLGLEEEARRLARLEDETEDLPDDHLVRVRARVRVRVRVRARVRARVRVRVEVKVKVRVQVRVRVRVGVRRLDANREQPWVRRGVAMLAAAADR